MASNATPQEARSTRSVLPIIGRSLKFARCGRTILNGVDIEIGAQGATLAVLGPNGAGKSVLLRMLAGLVEPDGGTITWAGAAPSRALAHRIGFVFQRPVLLRRTALENIAYAMRVSGSPAHEAKRLARDALEAAMLGHLATTDVRRLSAGEQQRLCLARALAMAPDVLILDEPTANLDPASTAAIEDRLKQAQNAGLRAVVVTHDLGQARRLASEVVFMHVGRILAHTPAQKFFANPPVHEAARFVEGEIVF